MLLYVYEKLGPKNPYFFLRFQYSIYHFVLFRLSISIICCNGSLLDFCQAYTTELEAEVAKLKEENEELRKRQARLDIFARFLECPRGLGDCVYVFVSDVSMYYIIISFTLLQAEIMEMQKNQVCCTCFYFYFF